MQGCLPTGLTSDILTVYTGISSQACTEAVLLWIVCLQAPARDTPACIASIVHWILSCTMKPGCKCTAQLQQSQQTQLARAFIQMQGVQQNANSQTGPGTRGVLVVHRHVCTCTMHACDRPMRHRKLHAVQRLRQVPQHNLVSMDLIGSFASNAKSLCFQHFSLLAATLLGGMKAACCS